MGQVNRLFVGLYIEASRDLRSGSDSVLFNSFVAAKILNLVISYVVMATNMYWSVGICVTLAHAFLYCDELTEWSEWTCCRRVVNLRSRERIVTAPRIKVEYQKCGSQYCLGR